MSEDSNEVKRDVNKRNNKKKGRINKKFIIVAGIILGLGILAVVGVYAILVHYYNKMNYVAWDKDYTIDGSVGTETRDPNESTHETVTDTPDDEFDDYQKTAQEALKKLGMIEADLGDVYNILLVGCDPVDPGDEGRSDTMMLISINNDTKKIIATSFLRDIYVYIPGIDSYQKLNAAYSYGGVDLLKDTLEYNFCIKIDRYVKVDFLAFIKVVDSIGGIDVEVQSDELYWLNQYIHASNLLLGVEEHSDYLSYADGTPQHLSGKQVLAYSRFRYVGNGDFTRTERQRYIVNIIFEKIKTISPSELLKLLDEVLPMVTTNVPTNEFISLVAQLPTCGNYEIVSWSIPNKGYKNFTGRGIYDALAIDFAVHIVELYKIIYDYDIDLADYDIHTNPDYVYATTTAETTTKETTTKETTTEETTTDENSTTKETTGDETTNAEGETSSADQSGSTESSSSEETTVGAAETTTAPTEASTGATTEAATDEAA